MEEIIGRSSPRGHGGSGSLLRKRCRSEMEAVRGLLKKAEALVRKAAAGAAARRPLPRRVKDKEAMTMAQKEQLVGLLSSLPAGILPSHVADFMRRRCSWRAVPGVDGDDDELEIDLGSTEDAALFELRKMLDDEAAVRRTSPRGLEDGEVADDRRARRRSHRHLCGGDSPLPAHEDLLDASPLVKPEADEFVDIDGDTIDKSPGNPNSTTTGSSSGNASGSSSTSASSSGSDSDSDGGGVGDTASSNPNTANHLPVVVVESVATKPLEPQPPQVAEQAYKMGEKLIRSRREAAPAPAPAGRMSELIARAQAERLRRDAERKRAREEQPR
ncbi:transcription factor GTE2-like [Oryza glaberrima]|uniref:transcription factor GTE2-like n=1 Tax=Oryza glaberrima TaxID=4538 RepID=UPI00023E165E|nr:transcription factor GTE2-like [Oryza glaberrima]